MAIYGRKREMSMRSDVGARYASASQREIRYRSGQHVIPPVALAAGRAAPVEALLQPKRDGVPYVRVQVTAPDRVSAGDGSRRTRCFARSTRYRAWRAQRAPSATRRDDWG